MSKPRTTQIKDVTATATELNILDGATLTTTELNYVDGVTSAIQTQLDSTAKKSANLSDLASASTARTNLGLGTSATQDVSLSNNTLVGVSAIGDWGSLNVITYPTLTETSYVKGVTSAIQTQLDTKITAYRYSQWFGRAYVATLADSTTYFSGMDNAFATSTSAEFYKTYINESGSIKSARVNIGVATPSSSETFSIYIRINNTTDYLISSSATLSSFTNTAVNNSLNIAVSQGDYFEIKLVTPAWATNPSGGVYLNGSVSIEVS